MMNYFVTKCQNNPFVALQAMVDGLRNQEQTDKVHVDMAIYGDSDFDPQTREVVCFGCAATHTIMRLEKIIFDHNQIKDCHSRSEACMIPLDDYQAFEMAMDYAREGVLCNLFSLFGVVLPDDVEQPSWHLTTTNFRDQLDAIQEWIDRYR